MLTGRIILVNFLSEYQENSFDELNGETTLIYTFIKMITSMFFVLSCQYKVLWFVASEVITVSAGKQENISVFFSVFSVSKQAGVCFA